jgi:hypothetical protein
MFRVPIAAVLLCLPAFAGGETPSIERALGQMYNFNFSGSQETLTQLIQAAPADPLPYAFRASAYLFSELDRMGILESEFLIDDDQIVEKKKRVEPDPRIRKGFDQAIADTTVRAEALLKRNANDKNALFAMSIAQGVVTDYMALVEKKQISSLSPAKKSNAYAQRLLKLDPKFYDAYLTAGFSEYMLASLPFFVKWFVRFENVSGSKEKGIENLMLAAREGRYFGPFAKILLGIARLREKKPAEARKLLAELAEEYPANPLFRKELVKLEARLGIAAN